MNIKKQKIQMSKKMQFYTRATFSQILEVSEIKMKQIHMFQKIQNTRDFDLFF
jgi:hypothetical protein